MVINSFLLFNFFSGLKSLFLSFIFWQHSWLDDTFFSTLNISFHSLVEKSADSLMQVSMYMRFFSLATFNLLFLSLILDSFIRMCLREDHFKLNCLDISEPHELGYPNIYPELGSSSHCLFKQSLLSFLLLLSFSDSNIFYRLLILILPHKSHRHTSFFFIFFPSLTKQFQMTFL